MNREENERKYNKKLMKKLEREAFEIAKIGRPIEYRRNLR
jgi:hypothetical protein